MQDLRAHMWQAVTPGGIAPGALSGVYRLLQVIQTGGIQRRVDRPVCREVALHRVAAAVSPLAADKNLQIVHRHSSAQGQLAAGAHRAQCRQGGGFRIRCQRQSAQLQMKLAE